MNKYFFRVFSITIFLVVTSCNNVRTDFIPINDKNGNTIIDKFNDVPVYLNNGNNARHKSKNGYNYGLEWQCVEFTKRYYYDYLNHKMPNTYGHAKDFYNENLKDGAYNRDRNLYQYSNNSKHKPKVNDIIIMDGHKFNPFGHIAIISKVSNGRIEIVQQNVGRTTRESYRLTKKNGKWIIKGRLILGRLRIKL